MKATTLRILVGVTTPLILTGSVQAGILGITVVGKPNAFGLLVCNVYAPFDRPGEDVVSGVAGTANSPVLIQVIGGTFYNHAFSTGRAPGTVLVTAFPSLAFDSFVTIGKKDDNGDELLLVEWPGFGSSVLQCDICGWAVTPDFPQGDPFDAVNSFPGNGQILIGQFSTANGTSIQGTMLLAFFSNGVYENSVVSFYHVPGPGALALLGAMGLLGSRRRR